MNAILAVSILVFAGLLGGNLARRLHLPSVTGNIVAGIIIGPYCSHLLNHAIVYNTLKPVSQIALSLIAVSIASHLKIRRLSGRFLALATIAVLQAGLAMAAVYFLCNLILGNWVISLLLAVVAASTAPAATLSVIRETEAGGPLVKNLLSVVALDNVLAIVLFVVVSVLIGSRLGGRLDFAAQALQAGWVLGLSLAVGLAGGLLLLLLARRLKEKAHFLSLLLMMVCFTTGLSLALKLSPLLPNMILGFVISNFSPLEQRILTSVEDIEPLLYVCFFTLAGTHLNLALLPSLGMVGFSYIIARYSGKVIGAFLGAKIGRSPAVVVNYLGLCLVPQAGVAIGLVVAIQENPLFRPYEAAVTAIILASIVVSELLGPVMVKTVLTRAGATGQAGHLLFGIVGREAIVCDLKADDKWSLLEEMVSFASSLYKLSAAEKVGFLHSVLERERSLSTGIGRGVAIPHGTISRGEAIKGVMAVVREGVDFNSLDGEKARVIILMLVPENCFQDHLKTLAAISKVFSRREFAARVAGATTSHEVYHLIFNEEIAPVDYLDGGENV